jgi:tRNA (guanine-N7-)-methyltransferase
MELLTKRPRLSDTKSMPFPNEYVSALQKDYQGWAYDEIEVLANKGIWRSLFNADDDSPLDLEIGTGNGTHFSHYLDKHPQRNLIGIELKYKPLIQTIRRAKKLDLKNGKVTRYNASYPQDIFTKNELNNVFIHFPDPWPKKRQKKNRLINTTFLQNLYSLQRPQSLLEFKTDNLDYFEWALGYFKSSAYTILGFTYDLHSSQFAKDNFVTQFESLFIRQGLKINYILLQKIEC